jgi:Protein of unknown function (DUF1761)
MSVGLILIAAAIAFGAASLWYMALAKRWVAATGRSEDEMRAAGAVLPVSIAFIAYVLVAGMMSHILAASGVAGFLPRLISGFGVGLFIAAPFILTNYAFAGRPRPLWWIDAGHAVVACTAIGAVLGIAG